MEFRSIRQVAALLGVKVDTLTHATWSGRIPAPAKSPSGSFLWTPKDIDTASWVLRGKPADDVLPIVERAEA